MAATRKRGRPKKQSDTIFLVIDMGTGTIYVVACYPDGRQEIIADWDGNAPTLTAIGFEGGDPEKLLAGQAALRYRMVAPEYVATLCKRTRGLETPLLLDANNMDWTGEALEVRFLKHFVEHVEERTGKKVAGILPTVPACFSDEQRRATIAIVEQAGAKALGVINEPTSALLGFMQDKTANGTFLVVDIGMGTSDVTAMRAENGTSFEARATVGRDDSAGREMTLALLELCTGEMAKKKIVLDPEKDLRDLVLLENSCEEAKRTLSTQEKAFITWRAGAELFDLEVTRAQFEAAIAPVTDGIGALIHETLDMAGLQPNDFDGVVLAGGASRVPAVQRLVENIFGADKLRRDVDPDKAIALGAAASLGIKIKEGIAAGDHELEAVAAGYALNTKMDVQEVLGQALGVRALNTRTNEEVLAPIAGAKSTLPFEGSKLFGLRVTGTGSVNATIQVLQGKADGPADKARVLAEFALNGLPEGPLEKRVEVSFSVDANGLVKVRAVDTFSALEITGQADAAEAVNKGVA